MDEDYLYEEWIPYDVFTRLMTKFEDDIGRKWIRMQQLGSEFKAYQEANYVYILMRPFVEQSRFWYNAMIKEGYAILRGREGSNYHSGLELFVPLGFRHAMMTSKANFYINCWVKFLDIYKWYMNTNSTNLSRKVRDIENDHTHDGHYEMRTRFLTAFNGATEGVRALNKVMSFDIDDVEEIPSYETIRYIVTQTFWFVNEMLRVNARTSRRNETPDEEMAREIAKQQTHEEKVHEVGQRLYNMRPIASVPLVYPGGVEDLLSFPRIRARPLKIATSGFNDMFAPMSPISPTSPITFHSPTRTAAPTRKSSPARGVSPVRTSASPIRGVSPVRTAASPIRGASPVRMAASPIRGALPVRMAASQVRPSRIKLPSGSRITLPKINSGASTSAVTPSSIPTPSGIPRPGRGIVKPKVGRVVKQSRKPYVLYTTPTGPVVSSRRGGSGNAKGSKKRSPTFGTRRTAAQARKAMPKKKKGKGGFKLLPSTRLVKKSVIRPTLRTSASSSSSSVRRPSFDVVELPKVQVLRPKITRKNRVSLSAKNLAKPRVPKIAWEGHVPLVTTMKRTPSPVRTRSRKKAASPKREASPKRVTFRDPPVSDIRLFDITTDQPETPSSGIRRPGLTPPTPSAVRTPGSRIPPPRLGITPPGSRIPPPSGTSGVKTPTIHQGGSGIKAPQHVTMRRSRSPTRREGPGTVHDPENLERLRAKLRRKTH